MKIKITKNPEEANLITHNNKFHPDDVFSTVFLSKYIDNPVLYRIPVGEVNYPNAIVYDVGLENLITMVSMQNIVPIVT